MRIRVLVAGGVALLLPFVAACGGDDGDEADGGGSETTENGANTTTSIIPEDEFDERVAANLTEAFDAPDDVAECAATALLEMEWSDPALQAMAGGDPERVPVDELPVLEEAIQTALADCVTP